MQRVTEQVDAAYLDQDPPRPITSAMLLNLLNEYVFDRPARSLLNPLLLAAVVALILLFVLGASPLLRSMPAILILVWMAIEAWRIWRRARDDLTLLRDGLTIRAHVLGLRPSRAASGAIDGALLDCAIPVQPRRTYVGSIWLSDGDEAQRLAKEGRLRVICLPRTPGTWRVIDDLKSEIRYDHMGPMQTIPHED